MINKGEDIGTMLSEIRSGKVGRDRVIQALYYDNNLRNVMRSMIMKKGGKADDFDMIFNTALMQFIKTVVKNQDFMISTSINSYILGISKFVWYKEIGDRSKKKTESIENYYNLAGEVTPESLVIDHSKKEIVHELLQNLGKNCKEVLMYWANGYKMIEIAKKLNYKSDGMAKKKKYTCFKQLLAFLEDNPHIKSLLR